MTTTELEDIETGHRMVAAMMVISTVVVAVSQQWLVGLRQWIADRARPGA